MSLEQTRRMESEDAKPAVVPRCKRCRHVLKKPKWIDAGYGPTCIQWVRYNRVMEEAKAHGWTNDPTKSVSHGT